MTPKTQNLVVELLLSRNRKLTANCAALLLGRHADIIATFECERDYAEKYFKGPRKGYLCFSSNEISPIITGATNYRFSSTLSRIDPLNNRPVFFTNIAPAFEVVSFCEHLVRLSKIAMKFKTRVVAEILLHSEDKVDIVEETLRRLGLQEKQWVKNIAALDVVHFRIVPQAVVSAFDLWEVEKRKLSEIRRYATTDAWS